ncbi:MAG TPA: hypothetical protein VMS56_11865 [Thermoanaerobaculia bacterium]|nr:hypothetical protein [Thermoanaerobaculia bacterium]
MDRKNLGDMLLAANLIDEVQMKIALAEQERTGKKFGSTLVDLKFIDENVLAAFLSKQMDVPCISLLHIEIPKKVVRRVPARIARECRAIPIRVQGEELEVAMVDPTDRELIEVLETATGMKVVPLIAPQSSLEKVIETLYPLSEEVDDTVAAPMPGVSDPQFRDLIEEIENADFEARFDRIEEKLDQLWTLLERVLRKVEDGERVSSED